MKCKEAKINLYDYLTNSLTENKKIEIENHLEICKKCNNELLFLKKYNKKLSNIKQEETSDNFITKINYKINQKKDFNILKLIKFQLPHISYKKIVFALSFVTVFILIIPLTFFMKPDFYQTKKVSLLSEKKTDMNIKIDKSEKNIIIQTKKSQKKEVFESNEILENKKNEPIENFDDKTSLEYTKTERKKIETVVIPIIIQLVSSQSSIKFAMVENEKLKFERSVETQSTAKMKKKNIKDESTYEKTSVSNQDKESVSKKEIIDIKKYSGSLISENEANNEIIYEIPSMNYEMFINDLKKIGIIVNSIPSMDSLRTESIQIKLEIRK
jgi:hypothetical protein